jgi:murein L,D-transpeptidase YafK
MKRFRIYFVLLFSACCGIAIMAFVPSTINTGKTAKQPGLSQNKKRTADSTDNPYYIIITKNTYELKVYDDQGWYATYPVVFGSKDLSDKMRQGDRRTPDGTFKVILKKINKDWGPELLLNYPTDSSYIKFKERKAEGLIPNTAKIGDGIAIHATRPSEEWTVDNFYNWTDGCISVKYTEMQDLYSYIPVGTPVTIVEQ